MSRRMEQESALRRARDKAMEERDNWEKRYYVEHQRIVDLALKHGPKLRASNEVRMTLTTHGLISESDAVRFQKYALVLGEDDCWEWQSTRNKRTGYGKFWLEGKTVGAHRVSYMIWKGAIPLGEQVRHTCDNPPCVNPAHLLTGTGKQNAADALERDKYRWGLGQPLAKLSPESVIEIRTRWKEGETQVSLARRFSVSRAAIQWVLNGRSWTRVEDAS